MSRVAHLHVLRENDDKTYQAVFCRRDAGGACAVNLADAFQVSCAVRFPFVDEIVCYEVSLDESKTVANVRGCASVKLPTDDATVNKALLCREADQLKGTKSKMNKCMKAVHQKSFMQMVSNEFGGNVAKSIGKSKYSMLGGYSYSAAILAGMLFCIGFQDRQQVFDVLNSLDHVCTTSDWFASLGDSDPQWTSIADSYETFSDLFKAARGSVAQLKKTIDSFIMENASKFFCGNTRPMAMRQLGEIHATFYATYSEMRLGVRLETTELQSVNPLQESIFLQSTAGEKLAFLNAAVKFHDDVLVDKCGLLS